MNEKAFLDSYKLFSSKGYKGSEDHYRNLLATNQKAFADSYALFSSNGYKGSEDHYRELMGLTQKKNSLGTSQEGVTESITEDQNIPTSSGSSDVVADPVDIFENKDVTGVSEAFRYDEFLSADEEIAKPILERALEGRGFTVEETGMGDALSVTDNKTNEVIEIDLQPFTSEGRAEEKAKLERLFDKDFEDIRLDIASDDFEEVKKDVALELRAPELFKEREALKQELNTVPTMSVRAAEIDKRLKEINEYRDTNIEDEEVRAYKDSRKNIKAIEQQMFDIENKYNELGDPTAFQNDVQYQQLQRQKELARSSAADSYKALEEVAKDTKGTVGLENWMHSITGLFANIEEADEIADFDEDLKIKILETLGSKRDIQRAGADVGGMTLREKEEVIAQSKIALFNEKYKEAEQRLKDEDLSDKEKKKLSDDLSLLMMDLGMSIDSGKFKIKKQFKKSEEEEEFRELTSENAFLDVVSTFGDAALGVALDYFVQSPVELTMALMGKINPFEEDEKSFTTADRVSSAFNRFTDFNYLPTSETEGLLVNEDGEFEFSFYGGAKAAVQSLPYMLGIMMSAKNGKMDINKAKGFASNLIRKTKNPKKVYEKYKLVTEMYRMSLAESTRTARDLGLTGTDAHIMGSAMAFTEGVASLVMPDTKYFKTEAGKVAVNTLFKNIQGAVSKKAKSKAATEFITNIAKEIGEEEAVLLGNDLTKFLMLEDHGLMQDFSSVVQQKQLVTAVSFLSGGVGAVRIPSAIKNNKRQIYLDAAENYEVLNEMIDDEIALFPEKKENLERTREYINDLNTVMKKAPKNVTAKQVEKLIEKERLEREKERVDEAFRGEYSEKIDQLNKEIAEEAVTEEAVTEEAATEEAATEEAVTEEAVTEEAVTEEAVAEEAVTEEAATEDAVTEEAVTEATPVQDELDNKIESFANRVVEEGSSMEYSDDAIQFYAENKEAIDKRVEEKKKGVPKDNSRKRSLALKIAKGETEFTDAEIDLYAGSESDIQAEVESIKKTNSQMVTGDTYKAILESTKRKSSRDKAKSESENAQRKRFWKSWNKSAREQKLNLKQKRKSLTEAVLEFAKDKKGKISDTQVKSVIRRIGNINLDNEVHMKKLQEYMEKVFTDADYANKLKKAKRGIKTIKGRLKNLEANNRSVLSEFVKINPNEVENIDALVEKIDEVLASLNKKNNQAIDLASMDQYTKETIDQINRRTFEDAFGMDSSVLTADEVERILFDNVTDDKTTKESDFNKREAAKKTFKNYGAIINSYLKGKDPFSINEKGELEDIDLPEGTKKLLKQFLELDLKNMSTKELVEVAVASVNLATNPTATGKIGAIVNRSKGRKGAFEVKMKGIVSRNLGLMGRSWNKYFSATNLMFEQLFGNQSRAILVEKLSGFTDLARSYTRADKMANKAFERYVNKYKKSKPNGKKFSDLSNVYERAIIAYMSRTVKNREKKEFSRRKSLIEDAIEDVAKTDPETAKILTEVYNKILKDAENLEQVKELADKTNYNAVTDMQGIWSDLLPKMKEISIDYYNKVLSEDLNYTPDFTVKKDDTKIDAEEEFEHNFGDYADAVYDKETGRLKASTKPKSMSNRRVSFDFESNNLNALKDAMRDVESAPHIQQIIGFINSKEYGDIFKGDDGRILRSRLVNYSRIKRNKEFASKEGRSWLRLLNRVSNIGAARALAGITQPIKQTVSVYSNTLSLLGSKPYLLVKAIAMYTTNKSIRDFVNNSDATVTQRGLSSVSSLEVADKEISEGKGKTILSKILTPFSKISEFMLNNFLVKPDVLAAKTSYLALYMKEVGKIDVNNENKDASIKADRTVSRAQNVSDADMMGEFFTSKDTSKQILRKMFFPFATFSMNQKTRMYSDFISLFRKKSSTTATDRADAIKSIIGTISEMVVFNTVKYMVAQAIANLAYSLIGYDEDDEDKAKREKNIIKGTATSMAIDFFSPVPFADPFVADKLNFILEYFQDDEDPFLLFGNDQKGFIEILGMLGIQASVADDLYEYANIAYRREYKDRFGRKKEVSKEGAEAAKVAFISQLLLALGLNVSEANSFNKKIIRAAKKMKEEPIIFDAKTDEIIHDPKNATPSGFKTSGFKTSGF